MRASAVWELERTGYIRRSQSRDGKGKMAEMVYTIYEQPVLENPISGEPVLENPTSDNPVPILSPPSPLKEAAAPPERKRTERNDAYKLSAGLSQLFTGRFHVGTKGFKAGALFNFCHVFITHHHCIVHQ